MDITTNSADFCVPVFFKNPDFIQISDYKDEALVAIKIGEAATTVVGDHIEGVQPIGRLWRIYPKNLQARVKLLTQGISLNGNHIPLLDLNPFKVGEEDKDSQGALVRITIHGIPLSVCNSVIKNYLAEKQVVLTGDVKYAYHRHPITNKLTNFKSGSRFAFASAIPSALPRNTTIGQFKCKVYHRDQMKKKCVVCDLEGHLPGTPGCPHFRIIPNITTIRTHTNVLSNAHSSPVVVNGVSFPTVEHAFLHRKAMNLGRNDVADEILDAEHAGIARAKASCLEEAENDPCFDLEFMESLLVKKMASSPAFRHALRETGQGIIAFCGGLNNGFWSTSLNEQGSTKTDPARWPGQNKLGELLAKIRDELLYPDSLSASPPVSAQPQREDILLPTDIDTLQSSQQSDIPKNLRQSRIDFASCATPADRSSSRKRTKDSPPDLADQLPTKRKEKKVRSSKNGNA